MRVNSVQINQRTNNIQKNNQTFGCVYLTIGKLGDSIQPPRIAVTKDAIGDVAIFSKDSGKLLGEFASETARKASELIDELKGTIEEAGNAKIFKSSEPLITHPKFQILKDLLKQLVGEAAEKNYLKKEEQGAFYNVIENAKESTAVNLWGDSGGFVIGSPLGKF